MRTLIIKQILESPIELANRRSKNLTPVTDELFSTYRRQFDYDPLPLNAQIEKVKVANENYTCEKVTINAAYNDERFDIYCYIPKDVPAPFHPVVIFPAADALYAFKFEDRHLKQLPGEFILNSGRAVIFPIYKSTYGRRDGVQDGFPNETNFYKDHLIMWTKDFRRTVDYLETRDDMDIQKLVFFGSSWGGITSGIIPAIDQRINVVISVVGGLTLQPSLPEVDQVNYLPRIRQPFLMLDGRYDFVFPLEESQIPMFELLGTPEENKKHVLAESTHLFPTDQLVIETLDWLDFFLGEVPH